LGRQTEGRQAVKKETSLCIGKFDKKKGSKLVAKAGASWWQAYGKASDWERQTVQASLLEVVDGRQMVYARMWTIL
jgi:hypothetical protein